MFDLPVPGYSLAEDLVAAGYTAYYLDVRGWGNSTPHRRSESHVSTIRRP